MAERACDICGDVWYARDWCRFHYNRWYRTGDPGAGVPKEIHAPGRGCAFPGCEREHCALGYCKPHWRQLKEGRELGAIRPTWNGAECRAEETCHDPVLAQGYCRRHYQAWQRHGDPLTKLPPAREGARRYALNESYFDEVNTEDRAYWLGFITADGGIIRGSKTFALRVELAERDGAHVQLLSQALGSDKPTWARRGLVGASFDSWRLVESLGRLGITPRKSATVKPWDGPADLMPHYWRGLFDGDGSLGRSAGTWALSISGSEACVKGFAAWACDLTGSRAVPRAYSHAPACWYWVLGGNLKAPLLGRALYENATVALFRKHELARKLIASG